MSNEKIKNLTFTEDAYPEVVKVANELADLEDRAAHDSVKRLLLEAGRKRIQQLKATKAASESQEQSPNSP